uniref:Uncharacterized protein n=1 Tax=Oryza punctata TaxID=4537 RepID=A0A0E0M7Q1_ORYPU
MSLYFPVQAREEPVAPNASLRVVPQPKASEGRVSQLRDALSPRGTTPTEKGGWLGRARSGTRHTSLLPPPLPPSPPTLAKQDAAP